MDTIAWDGLSRSLAVILVSEIGDKTFLLAALLAMRHSRTIVFAGAISALAVMSILSAALGHVVPALLPKRYTTYAAAVLFWFFGLRMLKEGLEMHDSKERMQEEIEEVEREVEEIEHSSTFDHTNSTDPVDPANPKFIPMRDLEAGLANNNVVDNTNQANPSTSSATAPAPATTTSTTSSATTTKTDHSNSPPPAPPKPRRRRSSLSENVKKGSFAEGFGNLCTFIFSPLFVKTFILTFVAEWGDRSQISTIALAAAHSVYIVSFGTILGHCMCTCVAVLGGRWLATKISVKHVTLGGAILFIIFGIAYTYEAIYWQESSEFNLPLV